MDTKTRPSLNTSNAAGSNPALRAIAIRWVYPREAFTPLVGVTRTLGRDPSCDTVLEGSETSKRHAEVRPDPPVAEIRDLGSTNGVHVNGKRVTSARIGYGTVVRLGEWVGVVIIADQPGRFAAITEGWYGGAVLAAAVTPARGVAATELPVIVEGETGTGKEGMARAVHTWSGRTGAFVAVNCAALPPTLAEGELFGYRKGAFTGADRASLGYFRAAHQGTIFLDEILDLPLLLQAKLLRVLEQGEVIPLGETQPVKIDARVVTASQEPLTKAVEDRRFRADLLARIDGVTVRLPPLRERREDVIPLFCAFLAEQAGGTAPALDARVVEQLLLYDWPLNVRELRMLARRLMVLHGHESVLRRAFLPERIARAGHHAAPEPAAPEARATSDRVPTDDDASFEALVVALRDARGNVSRAATALGITRARAYRLLEARPEFDRGHLEPPRPGPTEMK